MGGGEERGGGWENYRCLHDSSTFLWSNAVCSLFVCKVNKILLILVHVFFLNLFLPYVFNIHHRYS